MNRKKNPRLPLKKEVLTVREIECLIAITKYKTYKSAAKELKFSVKTLDTHLRSVKFKLGCDNIATILSYFMTHDRRLF